MYLGCPNKYVFMSQMILAMPEDEGSDGDGDDDGELSSSSAFGRFDKTSSPPDVALRTFVLFILSQSL